MSEFNKLEPYKQELAEITGQFTISDIVETSIDPIDATQALQNLMATNPHPLLFARQATHALNEKFGDWEGREMIVSSKAARGLPDPDIKRPDGFAEVQMQTMAYRTKFRPFEARESYYNFTPTFWLELRDFAPLVAGENHAHIPFDKLGRLVIKINDIFYYEFLEDFTSSASA